MLYSATRRRQEQGERSTEHHLAEEEHVEHADEREQRKNETDDTNPEDHSVEVKTLLHPRHGAELKNGQERAGANVEILQDGGAGVGVGRHQRQGKKANVRQNYLTKHPRWLGGGREQRRFPIREDTRGYERERVRSDGFRVHAVVAHTAFVALQDEARMQSHADCDEQGKTNLPVRD